MKKIFCIVLTLLALNVAKASNEPTLILEVQYTSKVGMGKLTNLQNDTNICCLFEVQSKQSTDNLTRVIHRETGVVLGTFYGVPSNEFILEIYNKQLTPEYINHIVPKLMALKPKG